MRWSSYLWTVAVNCFYLFIVLAIFDKVHHRPEAVTVAILGLIYVIIRGLGAGLGIYIEISMKQFERIRELLNDSLDTEDELWREARRRANKKRPIFYIDGVFLFVTSIICLLVLWDELWR